MTPPRKSARIAAGAATAILLVVAALAVWRHQTGGGDDPTTRQAVLARVEGAVSAASDHSKNCAERLLAMTTEVSDTELDPLETCGETARALAEEGYIALDEAAGITASGRDGEADGALGSPARAAYLDAAGALFSIYEIQGDDFDVIFDTLHRARLAQAPLSELNADVARGLANSAPDVDAAQAEHERAAAAYRRGG